MKCTFSIVTRQDLYMHSTVTVSLTIHFILEDNFYSQKISFVNVIYGRAQLEQPQLFLHKQNRKFSLLIPFP